MTNIETLISFRSQQAKETLDDAKKMIEMKMHPRSIVNRTYYSMFYIVLALLYKYNIEVKTSKHIGVISLFDTNFVHTNKIDVHFSKILHKQFKMRLKGDYKEDTLLTEDDAKSSYENAELFLSEIAKLINTEKI
jgi:hypothetical protein